MAAGSAPRPVSVRSPAPTPPAPTPPADRSPAAVVRWIFGVLNSHSAEPLRAVWSAETRERFPPRTYRGPDEIAGYFAGLFAALPDATFTVEALVADGETVFVRWRLVGTHTGAEFEGIAATGRRVDLDGVDHFVVRDGTVVSNFVVFDQMQLARQLGLLPQDGSRTDVGLKRAFNALVRLRG